MPLLTLQDRYLREDGQIFLGGLQAVIRVLIDQHRADLRNGLRTATFVSGYPGSPVGGFDAEFGKQKPLMDEHDIRFVPGLNEDLSATAVFGTQLAQVLPDAKYDGIVGMWFGKGPGVDRTADAFRHGTYRGMASNGAVLAVAGDDPAAKTSVVPNDSLPFFQDLMMPVVYPGDIQDVLDLGLHGLALSRAAGVGVGLKLTVEVADSSGTANVSPTRITPIIPTVTVDGEPFTHTFVPNQRNLELEDGYVRGRLEIAREYGRVNQLNPWIGAGKGARLGIVAPGKTYFETLEALRTLGLACEDLDTAGVRVMKVGLPFPMHPLDIREFAEGLDEIVVLEDKRPLIELVIKDALYGITGAPRIVGKYDEHADRFVPASGARTAESLAPLLARRLDLVGGGTRYADHLAGVVHAPKGIAVPLPVARAGHFCSGCPHTTGLKTPDGAIVGGGVGCHTMALRIGREEFGEIVGMTQMGGEGAQWVGAAPFAGTEHFLQNLGDGTFAHSGSLAVRFAVANNVNITYKLLYNSAVAMTGGQAVAGGKSLLDTVRLLEAEGVKKVVVTTEDPSAYRHVRFPSIATIRPREEIVEAQEELAKVPGVTVLVHDQQCAIEKKRDWRKGIRQEPVKVIHINERVCEGCGDCGKKSACLSVVPVKTEYGRKTQIHQSSCTKDASCLAGDCPSFVTIKPSTKKRDKPKIAAMPDVVLAEPKPLVSPDHFEIQMTGIAGTGVITVNQILATAAASAGRQVRASDVFGGAQKAGGVVSHLKISTKRLMTTSTVTDNTADALIVFDVLHAIAPANLAKAHPGRTVAVVSTNLMPTSAMVMNPRIELPNTPFFAKAIDANTRAEENVYTDAQRTAELLLGNHLATNLYLTGIAFQKGLIPLPSEALEHAIRLNGVAVEMNLAAFRWGRITLAHPDLLRAAIEGLTPDPEVFVPAADIVPLVAWADGALRELLEHRATDLLAYQDLDYVRRYVALVRRAADAADGIADGTQFALAVAEGYHKLLSYKDEYEVARLHLLEAEQAKIEQQFGKDAKVYWHLHPPMLRALGYDRKLVLGPWFAPAFHTLRKMRRLRGTKLDVFGYSAMRKLERELAVEYAGMIEQAAGRLAAPTLESAIALAKLPELVRGYEDVKLETLEEYRRRKAELLCELSSTASPVAAVA